MCAFDPTRDAIYISQATWDYFCNNEVYKCFDEIYEEVLRVSITSDVQHVALPATILDHDYYPGHLYHLLDWHKNIRAIYFIVGTPPNLKKNMEKENSEPSMQSRRWELRGGRDQAFILKENKVYRNRDAWIGGEHLYNGMNYAFVELNLWLAIGRISNFRIQPVYVVRK